MNRNPKRGDVIQLNGKRAEYLVTNSGTDPTGGWFTALPAKVDDPASGLIHAKREKTWHIVSNGDNAKHLVKLSDIVLTATAKFTTHYIVTKLTDVA